MKVGEQIWTKVFESLGDHEWKAYAILADAFTLFSQAIAAYDAGLNEATALMCRATLESGFFQFLTKKWNQQGFIEVENPVTLDGKIREVFFGELARAIKKRVSFSIVQVDAIKRIQESGNFVAHLASRKSKQFESMSDEFAKEIETIGKLKLSKQEEQRKLNELVAGFDLWIRPDEALQVLRDTASILLTLCRAMPVPPLQKS